MYCLYSNRDIVSSRVCRLAVLCLSAVFAGLSVYRQRNIMRLLASSPCSQPTRQFAALGKQHLLQTSEIYWFRPPIRYQYLFSSRLAPLPSKMSTPQTHLLFCLSISTGIHSQPGGQSQQHCQQLLQQDQRRDREECCQN